jgi:hypothetical protein
LQEVDISLSESEDEQFADKDDPPPAAPTAVEAAVSTAPKHCGLKKSVLKHVDAQHRALDAHLEQHTGVQEHSAAHALCLLCHKGHFCVTCISHHLLRISDQYATGRAWRVCMLRAACRLMRAQPSLPQASSL